MFREMLLLLALAAIACQAAPTSDDDTINMIYNNVIVGEYESAVKETKELARSGRGPVISRLVKKLTDNSQHNIIEYSHKLWNSDGKEIIKAHFPIQFRMLLNQNSVRIINMRDNLALKLGVAVDSDGDRIAYGSGKDRSSSRVSWKFIPFVVGNSVYFKILNVQFQQYLKLGVGPDSDGEYKGYSEKYADTYRHHWYLRPVSHQGKLLFYIVNREYNQALKLGRAQDDIGDRLVWGQNGSVFGKPGIFGWQLLPF